MEIINRWGYLNLEQIALLLKKNVKTTKNILSVLVKKKLVTADKLTRKAPDRFIKKLDNLQEYYKQGICVHWITPSTTLSNWIQNQINNYTWEELNTQEIWNNKE